MFKTFTKLNKSRLTMRKQEVNKFHKYAGNKQSLNFLKYVKSSRNFRKTNSYFKTNLSLKPIYDEVANQYKSVDIKNRNIIIFNFNKAPSMSDNYNKINKMIRSKRIQRLKEFENIHNKILINESELYRNKLYITASEYNQNNKNNLIKNNSCRELPIEKKKNVKKINKIKTFHKSNNFYTTSFINNSIKNLGISNLRNRQILSALTKDDIEKETNYALKTVSKMKMNLIDTMHNEFLPRNLINIEGRLVKFKLFQNIQTKKVNKISIINDFIKEAYLRRLKSLMNKFQKIYEKYSKKMNLYLHFLNNILDDAKEELKIKKASLFDLSSQIEKQVLKIINKQSELEYLVEIRNFLLKTKDTFNQEEKSQIYYDLLLIRDSKILIIGNILNSINFIKQIANRRILIFMRHEQSLKNKIINGDDKINLTEDFINSLDLGNYQLNQIFTSPEVFLKLYDTLTEKDLTLLFQLQISQRENNKLEYYYQKELKIFEKERDEEDTFKNLEEKEKLKEKLIEKYESLNKEYLNYNESYNNKIIPSKITSLKHKKKFLCILIII